MIIGIIRSKIMKDLYIVLLSCSKWWACRASTKEEVIEKVRDWFPGYRIINLFKDKDIIPYSVYEE